MNYCYICEFENTDGADEPCVSCLGCYDEQPTMFKRRVPHTNADRIRGMSDEELAEWVYIMVCKGRGCGICPMSDWRAPGIGITEWLKSPVEVDND